MSPGRANIAIYNWDRLPSVNVDLSTAGLGIGQSFEIRDVQNYFGAPVVRTTYTGVCGSHPDERAGESATDRSRSRGSASYSAGFLWRFRRTAHGNVTGRRHGTAYGRDYGTRGEHDCYGIH